MPRQPLPSDSGAPINDIEVGHRLRALRASRGLSIRALAEQSNLKRQHFEPDRKPAHVSKREHPFSSCPNPEVPISTFF